MALFESGRVTLDPNDPLPVEVRRGMTILDYDGQVAGKVAAVVVDEHHQNVTHLLLSRLPQIAKYRLVSVNLIAQVKEDIILLDLGQQTIESLPLRQAS